MTLTFQYYDAREKEETAEIMKVLHQRYQGKEINAIRKPTRMLM